jgi:hypothetical protein
MKRHFPGATPAPNRKCGEILLQQIFKNPPYPRRHMKFAVAHFSVTLSACCSWNAIWSALRPMD